MGQRLTGVLTHLWLAVSRQLAKRKHGLPSDLLVWVLEALANNLQQERSISIGAAMPKRHFVGCLTV